MKQSVTSEEQNMRVLKNHAYPHDFDCYKKAVETFSETCYNLGQVKLFLPDKECVCLTTHHKTCFGHQFKPDG